jgi:hypothetical protein
MLHLLLGGFYMIRNPSLVKRKQFPYDFCYKGEEEEESFCHLWVGSWQNYNGPNDFGKFFWTKS